MRFWAGAACSYALLTLATVLFDMHHLSVEAIEASRVSVAPPELISYVASLGEAVSSEILCVSVANRVGWGLQWLLCLQMTVTPFRCSYFPACCRMHA